MTSVTVNVKEDKYEFFLELLKSLDFAEVEEGPIITKEELKNDLVEAFKDVRLHQQGKKKLKTAKDFLDEL